MEVSPTPRKFFKALHSKIMNKKLLGKLLISLPSSAWSKRREIFIDWVRLKIGVNTRFLEGSQRIWHTTCIIWIALMQTWSCFVIFGVTARVITPWSLPRKGRQTSCGPSSTPGAPWFSSNILYRGTRCPRHYFSGHIGRRALLQNAFHSRPWKIC